MSIKLNIGNLFDNKEGFLVHGCNSHGIMGSGVAAQVRKIYPEANDVYVKRHRQEGLIVGSVIPTWIEPGKLCIINGITQKDMGPDSDTVYASYPGIFAVFLQVQAMVAENPLPVHFPLIGCGVANGDWKIVARIIDEALPYPIDANLWLRDEDYKPFVERYGIPLAESEGSITNLLKLIPE